jgi:hypothetical protein
MLGSFEHYSPDRWEQNTTPLIFRPPHRSTDAKGGRKKLRVMGVGLL